MDNTPTQPAWFRILPWVIALLLIVLGLQLTSPRGVIPATAPEDVFSAERALTHVTRIAVEPHPMGSAQIESVRTYIIGYLTELGVEVETQTIRSPDYYGDAITVPVVNITGLIPGRRGDGDAVALVAHYDTVPATPGANDNSVAVAALLETARALMKSPRLENDILLLFTDAEEPAPRYGSRAFVDESPRFADIRLAVNFEAIGRTGASALVEVNGPGAWLINELATTGSRPAAFSFLTETGSLLGDMGTDFDQFRNAGIPGFHFAYSHASSSYHTAADELTAVGERSLQDDGEYALSIARHFGNLDLTTLPGDGDSVFFSLGFALVRYPESWAVALMVLAVFGLGLGIRRRSSLSRSGHPLRIGAFVVAALVLGTLLWLGAAALRPTLGGTEGYFYFLAILGAIGYAAHAAIGRAGRGVLLCLAALTLLTGLVGRGFSYLFVWPAIAAAGAVWWPERGQLSRLLRFGFIAAVALPLLVPAVDLFLQLAHPRPGNPDSSIPGTIVVPLALGLLTTRLLSAFWPTPEPKDRPDASL